MSEFNIKVDGGSSVRLPTAGKYCDRDIVVTGDLSVFRGSFTLTREPSSSFYNISHGLGRKPDFYIVYAEGLESLNPKDFKGYSRTFVYYKAPVPSGTTKYVGRFVCDYGNDTGSFTISTSTMGVDLTFESKIQVYNTSFGKLKVGTTYHFICGVFG